MFLISIFVSRYSLPYFSMNYLYALLVFTDVHVRYLLRIQLCIHMCAHSENIAEHGKKSWLNYNSQSIASNCILQITNLLFTISRVKFKSQLEPAEILRSIRFDDRTLSFECALRAISSLNEAEICQSILIIVCTNCKFLFGSLDKYNVDECIMN